MVACVRAFGSRGSQSVRMAFMPKIFISYRREDSAYPAAAIRTRLSGEFGPSQIFFDVDSIPPGHDFRSYIGRTVGTCDYVLVIIGKHWLTATNPKGGRRLDSPSDFVRLEIRTALNRKVPVIPVLVDNAVMPKAGQLPEDLRELIYRQAILVRPEPDLAHDLESLAIRLKNPGAPPPAVPRSLNAGTSAHDSRLGKLVAVRDPSQPPSLPSHPWSRGGRRSPRFRTMMIVAAAVACPLVLGLIYLLFQAATTPSVAQTKKKVDKSPPAVPADPPSGAWNNLGSGDETKSSVTVDAEKQVGSADDTRSASVARINEALDQVVDFDIEPQSLKDAIEFIAARYQIHVLFDTRALDDANVDTTTEVKGAFRGIKLRSLLKLLLEQPGTPLAFVIDAEVLKITTVDKADEIRGTTPQP
jgi:hypothetical protein